MITLRNFRKSTLFMNALYLMASTFVVAASGLIFWIIMTKMYGASTIGLATTLLSVSGLLSLLGLAGFDTTFVRFLPNSLRKNDYIHSGIIIVTIASVLLALCFAIVLPVVSTSLSILQHADTFLSFVFFTTITSLNILTNAVFLAFKQAKYIFIINTITSIAKVALAFVAGGGNATTIFVVAGIAQLIGLVLSLWWMKRAFGYTFAPIVHMEAIRVVKKFSLSVYASSILNLLPPTLLPLIIVHYIGPANAAYYYMAFTIAGVLYTIAYASMQSVFAEGSHDQAAMRTHLIKAAKLIGVLIVPGIIIISVCSSLILNVFGGEYAAKGTLLLQLFAVGALPVAAYSTLGAIFKVTQNLRGVITMNIVYAAVILGLSYVLVPQFGVTAIGWAWILGNVAAAITGFCFLKQRRKA